MSATAVLTPLDENGPEEPNGLEDEWRHIEDTDWPSQFVSSNDQGESGFP